MAKSEFFIFGDSHPFEEVEDGITRQVLGYNDELMMVKASFKEGAIGYIHNTLNHKRPMLKAESLKYK